MYENRTSRKELAYPGELAQGSRGMAVQRLQEWLCFHGHRVKIDGELGPATGLALKEFQTANGWNAASSLKNNVWEHLTTPMRSALSAQPQAPDFAAACIEVAREHLNARAIEIGGDNRGPWVRLYTGGYDGSEWRWCAAFVSFVMAQTASAIGVSKPLRGSASCDMLALQAENTGLLVSGKSLLTGAQARPNVALFLIRRAPRDWSHTGFAFNFTADTFETIEGNTNDEGSAEGYEVCRRIRRLDAGKDFIVLP